MSRPISASRLSSIRSISSSASSLHVMMPSLRNASTNSPPLTPEQIFHDHAPRVYNLARRLLNNDADAEDVTQEVLLQVVRKLHTFRGDADIATWLHRVTFNAALAHRRKRARREAAAGACLRSQADGGGGTKAPFARNLQPKMARKGQESRMFEGEVVRSRGIEPPRAKPTATSTLRVYHFRHDRMKSGNLVPGYGDKPPRRQAVPGPAALPNMP